MVNATVDNEAISTSLSPGQSVTVPSGEIWDVTITVGFYADGFQDNVYIEINGTPVLHSFFEKQSTSATFVLDSGDTVACQNDTGSGTASGAHIGGYRVN